MFRKYNKKEFIGLLSVFVCFVFPPSARALNYEEGHQQMIKDLVSLIRENENLPLSDGTAEGEAFEEAVSNARARLSGLRCGFPNPFLSRTEEHCFMEGRVGEMLAEWEAKIGDPEERVSAVEFLRTYTRAEGTLSETTYYCYQVYIDPVQTCRYDESTNMDNFDKILIRELKYKSFERNLTSGECFMENAEEEWQADHYQALGKVLGRLAGKVDDEKKDSVLWIKPSNTAAGEAATKVLDKATNASLLPLKVIVAAFYCLARWFSGKSCDWGDGMDLLPDIPINNILGAMPGIGSFTNDIFVGFWHMMQVDYQGRGEYNDIPGTLLEIAGPEGRLGALDMTAMLVADLTGASLNAKKSNGVKRYGKFDKVSRSRGEWQSENIGHLEFSPLSNLADYGWKEFVKKPISAKFLGWPLHAMGDTMVPHHLVGTMSHGHAPFETAMDRVWPEIYQQSKQEILQKGFEWWKAYCYNKKMESVADMIDEVSLENRTWVGDWAWKDSASVVYWYFSETDEAKDAAIENAYTGKSDFLDNVLPLARNSGGAALALLLCASEMVVSPGHSAETVCPTGYGYCPTHACGFQCVEGYEEPPAEEMDTEVAPTTSSEPVIVI